MSTRRSAGEYRSGGPARAARDAIARAALAASIAIPAIAPVAAGRQAPAETFCRSRVLAGYDFGPNIDFILDGSLSGNVFAVATDAVSAAGLNTVHVHRFVAGQWVLDDRITNRLTDGPGARLTGGVAVDRGWIVVTGESAGAQFVRLYRDDFVRRHWAFESELFLSQSDNFTWFPESIDFADGVVAIRALQTYFDGSGRFVVVLFRYVPAPGQWALEDVLPISPRNNLGFVVAANQPFQFTGDTLVTGYPPGDYPPDAGPGEAPGLAYIYRRQDESGTWTREAAFEGDPLGFGADVAVDGDVAAVVTARHDPFGTGFPRDVHVYERTAHYADAPWALAAVLQPPPGDGFAPDPTVAIEGEHLFVSGRTTDAQGRLVPLAHHYVRHGGGWALQDRVIGVPALATAPEWDVSIGLEAEGEFLAFTDFSLPGPAGVASRSVQLFAGLTGADCNGNGLPDVCETAADGVTDCNRNGVPDACEDDCDGNGVVDDCDLWRVSADSGPGSPFGAGSPRSLVIPSPPRALSRVRIEVAASADLAGPERHATLRLNGIAVATLFESASSCAAPAVVETVEYSLGYYNALLGFDPEGDANFELVASDEVDPAACDDSFARIRVLYGADTGRDADGNGVPDACDPPMCEGLAATVYVDLDGFIVGGPLDGHRSFGILIGTPGNDVIVGTGSDEIIIAGRGDDIVCGGGGEDRIINPVGAKPAARRLHLGEPATGNQER